MWIQRAGRTASKISISTISRHRLYGKCISVVTSVGGMPSFAICFFQNREHSDSCGPNPV